jgi:hypothetical protein
VQRATPRSQQNHQHRPAEASQTIANHPVMMHVYFRPPAPDASTPAAFNLDLNSTPRHNTAPTAGHSSSPAIHPRRFRFSFGRRCFSKNTTVRLGVPSSLRLAPAHRPCHRHADTSPSAGLVFTQATRQSTNPWPLLMCLFSSLVVHARVHQIQCTPAQLLGRCCARRPL